MFKKTDVGALIAISIAALGGLLFYSYLGSMSRFLADDYCVAYFAERFGLLRSIWYWYITWSGTFSNSIFDWLLVYIKSGGIRFVTPVVLVVWVLITLISIWFFLPEESSPLIKYSISLAFGTLIVFATLLISPDVPQSLYWWTGMRAYILPIVIVTFYSIIFQWTRIRKDNKGIFFWSILSFVVALIIGGFSESFTPVLTVFFMGVVVLGLLTKKLGPPRSSFYFILGGMLGSLTSLIILITAPGNANRQAFYKAPPGIFSLLHISISAFSVFLTKILNSPDKISGIIAMFLISIWLGSKIGLNNKISFWMAPVILISGIALSYGCFLPAAWGLSDSPPDRNLSIPSFILVLTFIIAGFSVGYLLSPNVSKRKYKDAQTGLLALTLICVAFSTWNIMSNLYSERQPFIDYAQKWDKVNQQVIQSKLAGYEIVHIPAMDSWTTLDKPNDNPKFWLNICYSKYYGVQILSP